VDGIAHILAVKHLTTLFVNNLTLFVVYLVVIEKILTDTEVVALDLLLRLLDRVGKHLVLDLLVLGNAQRSEDLHQTLGTAETHQVVLQRDAETGFTRTSLTSGTSAQLIVDTSGFMALRTDDLQTAGLSRHFVQLDIRTTARHVGGDGNGARLSGLSDDLQIGRAHV